jgi:hypothetical protein
MQSQLTWSSNGKTWRQNKKIPVSWVLLLIIWHNIAWTFCTRRNFFLSFIYSTTTFCTSYSIPSQSKSDSFCEGSWRRILSMRLGCGTSFLNSLIRTLSWSLARYAFTHYRAWPGYAFIHHRALPGTHLFITEPGQVSIHSSWSRARYGAHLLIMEPGQVQIYLSWSLAWYAFINHGAWPGTHLLIMEPSQVHIY